MPTYGLDSFGRAIMEPSVYTLTRLLDEAVRNGMNGAEKEELQAIQDAGGFTIGDYDVPGFDDWWLTSDIAALRIHSKSAYSYEGGRRWILVPAGRLHGPKTLDDTLMLEAIQCLRARAKRLQA